MRLKNMGEGPVRFVIDVSEINTKIHMVNLRANDNEGEIIGNTIRDDADFSRNKGKINNNYVGNNGKKKSSKSKRMIEMILLITAIIGVCPIISSAYNKFHTKGFNGKWKITCNIKNSTLQRYIGRSSGWKIFFIQDGDKVSGKGEMFWVDNKEIPYSQHIPITMEGKIDGNNMILTYTQYGEKRVSYGEIKLKIDEEEIAEGNFSGTAANTSGTSKAEKLAE